MKKLFNKQRSGGMNKKGQMIVVLIMIAMACIITAVIFIQPLKEVLGQARTDLNCANHSALSTGESMTCIGIDFMLPMFVLTCMGVGLAYLGAKQIGGQ